MLICVDDLTFNGTILFLLRYSLSTILDYLGASEFDTSSDGRSLRRFIEGTSFNKFFDENTVVCELDERSPKSANEFDSELGAIPNFMIRKGSWKLMLPKKRDSPVLE